MERKDKEEHPAQIWRVRNLPRSPSWRLLPDPSFICLFFCRCVYTCRCMCTDVWGQPEGTSALSAGESLQSGLTLHQFMNNKLPPKGLSVHGGVLGVGGLCIDLCPGPMTGKRAILGQIQLLDLLRHNMKPLCNTFPQAT